MRCIFAGPGEWWRGGGTGSRGGTRFALCVDWKNSERRRALGAAELQGRSKVDMENL